MLCLSDYFALGYHLSCPVFSRMNYSLCLLISLTYNSVSISNNSSCLTDFLWKISPNLIKNILKSCHTYYCFVLAERQFCRSIYHLIKVIYHCFYTNIIIHNNYSFLNLSIISS